MMRRVFLLVTFILLTVSMWVALTAGQIEGPPANPASVVRNIIYAHIPSSICSLLCFVVLLVAGIAYLCTGSEKWDILANASAEVGAIFATVLNLTGSIFSRAEWGIWWTPSPRLVTAAILWFLYIVYLILRSSLAGSEKRRARICAVFAIIAFLDVPMVLISARFIPDIHRANFQFTLSGQRLAFFLSMFATVLLAAMLMWIRTEILTCRTKLQQQDCN